MFFSPRISRIFVQASAEGKFTWTMPSAAENVKKFTRNILNYINGDLVGRTNLTNFRASERRAEFIRAMPIAAENLKANTLN